MGKIRLRKAPVVFAGFVVPACLAVGQSVCASGFSTAYYFNGAPSCTSDQYIPQKCLATSGTGVMCTYNWSANYLVLYQREYSEATKKCLITGYSLVRTDTLTVPGPPCHGG